jgi:hypothetical protein
MGVVGGSVPGVAGEGTSMSGPGCGAPGGAVLGCPGWEGCAGSGVEGGLPGTGGSSGVSCIVMLLCPSTPWQEACF